MFFLPRLSDDSIAVAHHGTRLGLTDEARLGAVVVMRRIVVMGIVVLMMEVQIILSIKKDAGPGAPHLFVYVPALYLASRPARMALMLVSTTASPLRPKMALMAFSSSSKAISR